MHYAEFAEDEVGLRVYYKPTLADYVARVLRYWPLSKITSPTNGK
jgi:hypothetical protein